MKLNKNKKFNIIIIILCLAFFALYSFLIFSTWLPNWQEWQHLIFNWPDANANYFFVNIFSDYSIFQYFEVYNELTNNLLHTRSINVIDANLVPMTWLPVIAIWGWLAKLLGSFGVLFVTPALASISVYLAYRLTFYIFKDIDLAFLVALLLLPLAPWMYFANIVMLPHILFIFLVLSGWLLIVKHWQNNKILYWILGSLLLSLAVVVRPTEIIWLALLSIIILFWQRHKINFKKILIGLLVFVLIFIWFLYLNKFTYGSLFSFGYLNLQTGGVTSELSNSWLPFGFNLKLIISNFYKYFVSLQSFHFIFALAGLVLMLFKIKKGTHNATTHVWQKYLKLYPIIFIIILLFYGSWDIADPLVKELNTISISYVRYFLPLYIWILPLTALGIKVLFYNRDKLNYTAYWVIIIALGIFSFKTAFFADNDGLLATRDNINIYYQQFAAVKDIAPQNSIIVTDRSDKIFFPYYKVVVPQGDLPLWERLEDMTKYANIYYFTDKTDINPAPLNIQEEYIINNNFKLYRLNN
jgi:hypothetical protein